jgi:hypothetical protein
MKKQHKHFKPVLKWWLIFCTVVFATLYSQISLGLFSSLNSADVTKISFVIIAIFYIYMIMLGVRLSKFCKNIFNQFYRESFLSIEQHGWFLSDIFMALGFLGTLIGFMYMLDLTGLNNANAAQGVLITLTTGLKTAIYTTVMGLISGLIIKCTLYAIRTDLNKIDECKLVE